MLSSASFFWRRWWLVSFSDGAANFRFMATTHSTTGRFAFSPIGSSRRRAASLSHSRIRPGLPIFCGAGASFFSAAWRSPWRSYRRNCLAALDICLAVSMAWGTFEHSVLYRYPAGAYLLGIPFMAPAYLAGNIELIGRLTSVDGGGRVAFRAAPVPDWTLARSADRARGHSPALAERCRSTSSIQVIWSRGPSCSLLLAVEIRGRSRPRWGSAFLSAGRICRRRQRAADYGPAVHLACGRALAR